MFYSITLVQQLYIPEFDLKENTLYSSVYKEDNLTWKATWMDFLLSLRAAVTSPPSGVHTSLIWISSQAKSRERMKKDMLVEEGG